MVCFALAVWLHSQSWTLVTWCQKLDSAELLLVITLDVGIGALNMLLLNTETFKQQRNPWCRV